MIIYNLNDIKISINLDIVPSILTFNIKNEEYKYTLGAEDLDNCPYDKQIQEWFIQNNHTLTEIVWEWNLNKDSFSKIKVPLKI